MATMIVFEERVEIPSDVQSLADFRRWTLSPEFPNSGRIDYIRGRIEVDMSPEELFVHGSVKVEIVGGLLPIVKKNRGSRLFSDRVRVSCPSADLSVEPDVVFVFRETIRSGLVRLVPKATGEPGRYVELEGAPDMVAEIVSDTSVTKDTRRLPQAYFQAGIREFWLVDARGESLRFEIHVRGKEAFEPVEPDPHGFQESVVFGCCFRLDRRLDEDGLWEFNLLSA
jgi:Uma2 family endonuclease